MKNFKWFYALILVSSFFSCDPPDNRMRIENKTDNTIYACVVFEEFWHNHNVGEIEPHSRINYETFPIWEVYFAEYSPGEKSVSIFIKEKYFKNAQEESIKGKVYWNDVTNYFNGEQIYYRQYGYEEIKSQNWEVKFPDDGFRLVESPDLKTPSDLRWLPGRKTKK